MKHLHALLHALEISDLVLSILERLLEFANLLPAVVAIFPT